MGSTRLTLTDVITEVGGIKESVQTRPGCSSSGHPTTPSDWPTCIG